MLYADDLIIKSEKFEDLPKQWKLCKIEAKKVIISGKKLNPNVTFVAHPFGVCRVGVNSFICWLLSLDSQKSSMVHGSFKEDSFFRYRRSFDLAPDKDDGWITLNDGQIEVVNFCCLDLMTILIEALAHFHL